MVVRKTEDRPASNIALTQGPWSHRVQASSPLSELGVPTKENGQSRTLLFPLLRSECTMTIYQLLSVLPTKQEKQKVQSAMSPGWSAVKCHSLSSPLPCSQGVLHCSVQAPHVGQEEYLSENPSVWWVGTELWNWIAKNCDLSYELQPHRILSFLYLERTHTIPIEGIRGTKLEDRFKEDPSFKNLCSWCWGDGFEVKRAGNLTKDRVYSPRTDITTHNHPSLHFQGIQCFFVASVGTRHTCGA